MLATWEVLVLDRFLNPDFVISPRKQAHTAPFYGSQHKENYRQKTKSYVYTVLSTIY